MSEKKRIDGLRPEPYNWADNRRPARRPATANRPKSGYTQKDKTKYMPPKTIWILVVAAFACGLLITFRATQLHSSKVALKAQQDYCVELGENIAQELVQIRTETADKIIIPKAQVQLYMIAAGSGETLYVSGRVGETQTAGR